MGYIILLLSVLLTDSKTLTVAARDLTFTPTFSSATSTELTLNHYEKLLRSYGSGVVSSRRPRVSSSRGTQLISVVCTDHEVHIAVPKDYLGPMRAKIKPEQLILGNDCKSTGETEASVTFTYGFDTCGTELKIIGGQLVYTNSLYYISSTGTKLKKLISVHCHSPRDDEPSSHDVRMSLIALSHTPELRVMDGQFDFSLSIMTDDWSAPSDSRVFYLGEKLNLQASVTLYGHAHLRLFIDSCVATPARNGSWEITYPIIQDYGCLVDSQVSSSRFLQSDSGTSVKVQIQTFQFKHLQTDQVFIHCAVKLADEDSSPNDLAKSCQYNKYTRRWEESDGDESVTVCSCCEKLSCGQRGTTRNTPFLSKGDGSNPGQVDFGPLLFHQPQ